MPEVLTQAAAAIPPARDYITVETNVVVRCVECGQTDCATAIAAATRIEKELAERTRLEREVIEAAKAWKLKRDDGDNEKWSVHYVTMCDAIQALIDFESKQHQIKK